MKVWSERILKLAESKFLQKIRKAAIRDNIPSRKLHINFFS